MLRALCLIALGVVGATGAPVQPACTAGEEFSAFSEECVAISCDAPNACAEGFTCTPSTRACITSPCPQFDCIESNPDSVCIAGEVFNECGSACTPTCDNPTPLCSKQCVARCECPVSKSTGNKQVKNENGVCVDLDQCSPTCVAPDDYVVPEGETYFVAGNNCNGFSCLDGELSEVTIDCVPEFLCASGALLPVAEGDCCAKCAPVSTELCAAQGKVYQECGSSCGNTCEDKINGANNSCTFQCVEDCFCPEGQFLDSAGNCVSEEECRNEVCADVVCPGAPPGFGVDDDNDGTPDRCWSEEFEGCCPEEIACPEPEPVCPSSGLASAGLCGGFANAPCDDSSLECVVDGTTGSVGLCCAPNDDGEDGDDDHAVGTEYVEIYFEILDHQLLSWTLTDEFVLMTEIRVWFIQLFQSVVDYHIVGVIDFIDITVKLLSVEDTASSPFIAVVAIATDDVEQLVAALETPSALSSEPTGAVRTRVLRTERVACGTKGTLPCPSSENNNSLVQSPVFIAGAAAVVAVASLLVAVRRRSAAAKGADTKTIDPVMASV